MLANASTLVRLSLFAGVFASAACGRQPEHQTSATVIAVAPHANPKWYPDEVVVTALSQGGSVGSKSITRARLNCRVGDVVSASARGIELELDERACQR